MLAASKIKMKTSVRAVALALALSATSFSAQAVLERVGPINTAPSVGNYPAWYQDTTGLALEFCDPRNQAELDGGWCLLLPGDLLAVPEAFPNNFFDEHFYFAGVASAPVATGARALLVLAEEAAFAVGPARAGDQITFARIRIVLNPVPVTGTYRFIHPYGEDTIEAVAGDRIFYTEDIGIGSPGDFTGSLNSRLGPFLLPSATPGGAEMPALTAANPTPDTNPAHFGGAFTPTPYPGTGSAYIADPSRIGPVTGSSLPNFIDSTGASRNHNIFRIEGPAGSALGVDPGTGASVDYVETVDFNLMGRVMTGVLPSRIEVSRASYARDAAGIKLDVFASAAETSQARLPGQPRLAAAQPQLTFFDAPCGGVVDALGAVNPPYTAPLAGTEHQMFNAGSSFWGQTNPAAIPAAVCVKDASARDAAGNTVPVFAPRVVSDDILISRATYDPASGTLTVAAASSDTVAPPTLTLAYDTSRADLVNGQIAVTPLLAPPAKIRVLSSAFGANESQVTTSNGAVPTPGGIPVAANDAYTFAEDSGAQILAVLANDSNAAGGVVSITTAPRLGTATVNTNGTITYTPNLNASGTDSLVYSVSVGGQASNTASVTLDITPVNDAPVAVNDSTNAIVNVPLAINVVGNDTDPDGASDIVAALIVTPPASAASVSVAGGTVTFNATAPGTYSFTYQAQDAAGLVSANTATVTVQVAGNESVTISKNEYVRSKSLLKAQGTVTPAAGQTVRLEFVNSSTGAVVGSIGTYPTDGAGNWQASVTVPLPTGANVVRATSSNGTVRNTAISFK
jgi:hypothetical protein